MNSGVKQKSWEYCAVLYACLLVSVIVCKPALGAEAPSASTDQHNTDCTDLFPEDDQPAPAKGFFSFMDSPQQSISNSLESMVKSVDAFFANESVLYESSGSYIRYSLGTLFEEGGRTTTLGKLDLNVRLPRTEQKLMLVLESDPAEQQTTLERASNVTTSDVTTTTNYYAGLQGAFGKQDKWRFKPSIGLKLHFPVQYYVRLRAFRDIPFNKWNLRLTESAYWYDTTGGGFDSEFEWNRLLRDDLLFSSRSMVRNTEQYHRFDLSQTFSLTQVLSARRAITWSMSALGNSDPRLHATDYLLQMRYRQVIEGDYFFMEVMPQIRYRQDYAFTQEDSFLLRFEWLFQKK